MTTSFGANAAYSVPYYPQQPQPQYIHQQQPQLYQYAAPGGVLQAHGLAIPQQVVRPVDEGRIKLHQLVTSLLHPDQRESALYELSKQREAFSDLAPTLWYSCGVMAVLLQEIVNVYPSLIPPTLQVNASNRVCNALALLQCVAAHNETRAPFLAAHIPFFLYPFLNTVSTERPFEYLRLTSLGVIGALVKSDEVEVIKFLLTTEIVPLSLKIMDKGTELSKTVATFVVQKILMFDVGLQYICATPDRFMAVAQVLRTMVQEQCTNRLLRHIVRCYLRLTEHPRAREALKQCLPEQLRNGTFNAVVADDANVKKWLYQLLVAVGDPGVLALDQQQQAANASPAKLTDTPPSAPLNPPPRS